MKKNLLAKFLTMLFVCSILVTNAVPVYASAKTSAICATDAEIEPRTDIKGWVYKVIDGDLYKRLYNYTRNRYEGDWIFVASGVEE